MRIGIQSFTNVMPFVQLFSGQLSNNAILIFEMDQSESQVWAILIANRPTTTWPSVNLIG